MSNQTVLVERLCPLREFFAWSSRPFSSSTCGRSELFAVGQEPGQSGAVTHCGHLTALASSCPRWRRHLWGLRTRGEFGPRRGCIRTALLLLGFSLRSEVEAGFSRRVTGTRGIDSQLPVNGDKANGAPSLPSAHTALTAPQEGQKGPRALDLPGDVHLDPALVLGHRHPESDPFAGNGPQTGASSPSLEEGGRLYLVTAGDPWLSRVGSQAPPPNGSVPTGVQVSGRVCPCRKQFEWEESCVSDQPPGSLKSPQPPALGPSSPAQAGFSQPRTAQPCPSQVTRGHVGVAGRVL